jgi:cell division protein FtsB
MNKENTDTPRTDAAIELYGDRPFMVSAVPVEFAEGLERELAASKAEVVRLTQRMKEAEDLIKGLHDGWKKARTAHLETCKNAQAEIDKLHTENVCLQELIQEFYEWSRRDFPTEQEVREIMNRYYDLLNK